ncbi:MAG: ATP-binding protein [Candidatus Rokubacteria bacterium]|nr:ATP-binding protein [Candidatus Rokubacteria bacterium]
MGETRVDLLHLLEDLRDAYPGAAEETILTEVVANSLDSGATTVTIAADPSRSTLTIVDDGVGMRRRDLARYHDVAATTKVRGDGIGFAGVGIKVGLLVSEEVLTESRLGKHHMATVWRLASRHRAPWKWVPPPGLVAEHGTVVRLQLKNPLSPLLDPGFIEGALWRHFQPLLDPALVDILAAHYPRGVRFVVNGRPLPQERWEAPERAPITVRLARKRKPSASGYLIRDPLPLPEERRGLAISTFGKVIKRGWDWLLAYRKAIQEAVARQLAAWGDIREGGEQARRRAARPVERDLEAVLLDLADEFPLLAALVERRAGGQRALPMGQTPAKPGEAERLGAVSARTTEPQGAEEAPAPTEPSEEPGAPEPAPTEPLPPSAATVELPATRGPRRPARYGLSIQFEQRPDDPELARLVETTVWINEAHPAYRRAVASRSEGYHIAVASAMALASLAVEPDKEHAFVTAFLASWGAALDRRKGRGQR